MSNTISELLALIILFLLFWGSPDNYDYATTILEHEYNKIELNKAISREAAIRQDMEAFNVQ